MIREDGTCEEDGERGERGRKKKIPGERARNKQAGWKLMGSSVRKTCVVNGNTAKKRSRDDEERRGRCLR